MFQSTRNRAESAALRAKIWDMFLGDETRPGLSQYEIAKQLNCTQQNVSAHIRKSITGWINSNQDKIGQYLAREIQKTFYWEAKAAERYEWAEKAWKKSIGTVKVITKTGRPSIDVQTKETTILNPEVTIKEEKVVGNPQLLRSMNEAAADARAWHERRCKLLGLDAAQKMEMTGPVTITVKYADELPSGDHA